jgi:hypothetical protein
MPMQALDGTVTINLGAKGVVELELVSSGERWGIAGRSRICIRATRPASTVPRGTWCRRWRRWSARRAHARDRRLHADKARPLNAAEKALIREAAGEE